MQEGIQISSFIVSHQPGLCKRRRCRGTWGLCFWIPRTVTFTGKEVNKLVWRTGFGSWIPGHRDPQDQSSKALPRPPARRGGPSWKSRRRRKCCCPQVSSSWLSVHFSGSRLQRTDCSPLRSTWSPPRAGCNSQSSGVCGSGTCGTCGGSGSSPHTQSCSSPQSWGHSSPRS